MARSRSYDCYEKYLLMAVTCVHTGIQHFWFKNMCIKYMLYMYAHISVTLRIYNYTAYMYMLHTCVLWYRVWIAEHGTWAIPQEIADVLGWSAAAVSPIIRVNTSRWCSWHSIAWDCQPSCCSGVPAIFKFKKYWHIHRYIGVFCNLELDGHRNQGLGLLWHFGRRIHATVRKRDL